MVRADDLIIKKWKKFDNDDDDHDGLESGVSRGILGNLSFLFLYTIELEEETQTPYACVLPLRRLSSCLRSLRLLSSVFFLATILVFWVQE